MAYKAARRHQDSVLAFESLSLRHVIPPTFSSVILTTSKTKIQFLISIPHTVRVFALSATQSALSSLLVRPYGPL